MYEHTRESSLNERCVYIMYITLCMKNVNC